jgi:hypothetical protein
MRFAAARDLITPCRAMQLSGYSSRIGQDFTAIHDDLYVRALLMEDDAGRTLVLLALDLCFHERGLAEDIAAYARDTHGVEAGRVFVNYTHTHTGPAVENYDRGRNDPAYAEMLRDRCQRCIDRAFAGRFVGTLEVCRAEGEWNVNRRLLVDGRCTFAPNFQGPRDRQVDLLAVRDDRGRVRAAAAFWSCHPVSLTASLEVSADFPGRICHHLESRFYGATGLFFQSAGGNLRPRMTAEGPAFRPCSYEELDDMAASIAERSARAILEGGRPIDLEINGRRFDIPLPLAPLPREQIRKHHDETDETALRAAIAVVLEGYDTSEHIVHLPAGVARLDGETCVALLGGEPTYEVKQLVADAIPAGRVLFMGYADDTAYIPTDRQLTEGGYEADQSMLEYAWSGPFAAGIDGRLAGAFRRAWEEISAGP